MRLLPLLPHFSASTSRQPLPCRRVFDHLSKIPCEAVMNAKTTGLILLAFLLALPILACADDRGSSGGRTSSRVGNGDLLKLLPEGRFPDTGGGGRNHRRLRAGEHDRSV